MVGNPITFFFFSVSLFLPQGQEKGSLNEIETLESLYGLITNLLKTVESCQEWFFYRKKGSTVGITGEGKEKEH